MIQYKAENYDFSSGEKTELTSDVAAAATSVLVNDYDGLADNYYLIIGNPGQDGAEVVQINGAVSSVNVTVTALKYAHDSGEPVTVIPYNQVILQKSTDGETGWSDEITKTIEVDQLYSMLIDPDGTTALYYRHYFKNEETGEAGDYSAAIIGSGHAENSRGWLRQEVTRGLKDPYFRTWSPDDIDEMINQAQRLLYPKLFKRITNETLSTIADTYEYDFPSGISIVDKVEVLAYSGASWYVEVTNLMIDNDSSKVIFADLFDAGLTIRLIGRYPFAALSDDNDVTEVSNTAIDVLVWKTMQLAYEQLLIDKGKLNQYAANVKEVTETDVERIIRRVEDNIEKRIQEISPGIESINFNV